MRHREVIRCTPRDTLVWTVPRRCYKDPGKDTLESFLSTMGHSSLLLPFTHLQETLKLVPKKQQVRKQSAQGKFSKWGFRKELTVLLLLLFQQQGGSLSGNTGAEHNSQMLVPEAIKKSDQVTQLFLGLQEKKHPTAHFSLKPPQCTIPCATTCPLCPRRVICGKTLLLRSPSHFETLTADQTGNNVFTTDQ